MNMQGSSPKLHAYDPPNERKMYIPGNGRAIEASRLCNSEQNLEQLGKFSTSLTISTYCPRIDPMDQLDKICFGPYCSLTLIARY